jgi:DNA-binding NtrC family response regulator
MPALHTPEQRSVVDLRPILIVEDDLTVRASIRELLFDERIATVGAHSIEEARRYIETTKLGGVIVDYVLSDGTADTLIDAIVAMRGGPPVVLASAHGEVELLAKHYGIPFVRKPYDLEAVVASSLSLLDGHGHPAPARTDKPHVRIGAAR